MCIRDRAYTPHAIARLIFLGKINGFTFLQNGQAHGQTGKINLPLNSTLNSQGQNFLHLQNLTRLSEIHIY